MSKYERETIQQVIEVLEGIFRNPNVLPEDKMRLAYCLDGLTAIIREEDE